MKEKQQGFLSRRQPWQVRVPRSRCPGAAGILNPTLGAQEGPQHRDSGEEKVAAAQAAAGAVAGEDGLRGFIQGLICGTQATGLSPSWAMHSPRSHPGLGRGVGRDGNPPPLALWITHGVRCRVTNRTWVLTKPRKTLTGWTDVNFQSQAGPVHKVGRCGSWKRGQPPGGLYPPFSTLLTQPIKLLTMCQNPRHNALCFTGVSFMFPPSKPESKG